MKKFVCTVCGYVYEGEELPEDYECPCAVLAPTCLKKKQNKNVPKRKSKSLQI